MARVLLIEDEPAVRRTIQQMLLRGGHEVAEASDGDEGLRLARSDRPDIVITDLMMPGKEGIETVRELRRDAPALPILVISGNAGAALYMEIATMLGAQASLAKPLRSADLLAAVARLLPANR